MSILLAVVLFIVFLFYIVIFLPLLYEYEYVLGPILVCVVLFRKFQNLGFVDLEQYAQYANKFK